MEIKSIRSSEGRRERERAKGLLRGVAISGAFFQLILLGIAAILGTFLATRIATLFFGEIATSAV